MVVITSRLEKDENVYRIEVPQDYVEQLGWRKGQILQIDVKENKLQVEKLQGFMGA